MWMQLYIARAKTQKIARSIACFFLYVVLTIPLPGYENFVVVAIFVTITATLLLFQSWILVAIGYEKLILTSNGTFFSSNEDTKTNNALTTNAALVSSSPVVHSTSCKASFFHNNGSNKINTHTNSFDF